MSKTASSSSHRPGGNGASRSASASAGASSSAPIAAARPEIASAWTPGVIVIACVVGAFLAGLFVGQEFLHTPNVVMAPAASGMASADAASTPPGDPNANPADPAAAGAAQPGHDDASLKSAIASEKDPQRLTQIGQVLSDENRPDLSVLAYERALHLGADTAEVHRQLGLTYWSLNKISRAVGEINTALKLNPNDVASHAALGFIAHTQGHTAEARAEFTRALKLRPPAELKARIQTELSSLLKS
jgi:cytochrome c-type biogenesis protein CcmH/NrfG